MYDRETNKETISTALNKRENQFDVALQEQLPVKKFISMAFTALTNNPDLLKCSMESKIGCLLQCAEIGLYPDKTMGFAYLIPYKATCTLIVGYKGWRELAYRTGAFESIYARTVYSNEEFECTDDGVNSKITHKMKMADRGEVIGYYAKAVRADGNYEFEIMPLDEVNSRHKNKAKSQNIWTDHPEMMGKKCVIRRLCERLKKQGDTKATEAISKAIEVDGKTIRADKEGNLTINGDYKKEEDEKPDLENELKEDRVELKEDRVEPKEDRVEPKEDRVELTEEELIEMADII